LEKKSELVSLHKGQPVDEKAYILIVRNFLSIKEDFEKKTYEELKNLKWDTKAFMRGQVKNKHARYNLCFDKFSQAPDYENKKGTIVKWDDVIYTKTLKCMLENILNVTSLKNTELIAEGNRYFDITKCGIGYHGDSERKLVIGCRFGASMNLKYKWFFGSEEVGTPIEFNLNSGDIYFMSEKAVGFDWKKRKIFTLRHSAGCKNYTK
jgi:hypothetical protein